MTTGAGTPLFHMLDGAPKPVAPYSHAVEIDGWVFLTGQLPNDRDAAAAPLPDGIEAQTRQTMENLGRVLAGLGLGLEHLVAARVFLTRFDADYQRMNRVYESYFAPGRLPARTCVGVTALALGARIEIDAIARRSSGRPGVTGALRRRRGREWTVPRGGARPRPARGRRGPQRRRRGA